MAPEVRLNAQQAAARVEISYQHFRRLRGQGHVPTPDGWFGKLAWWKPSTIDKWKRDGLTVVTEQTA